MSERAEIEHAIKLFFEAMNNNTTTSVPLADDIVIRSPMMPEPIAGEAAVRQYLDETTPFIAKMEPERVVIEGDNAAVSGKFEGLNGVVLECAYFFRVKDGLISEYQVFFDTRLLFKGVN